ncbi:hypothetical protein GIW81_06420 [Hyphomicrobium sp. xq]|uniref:Uncharacterized protein n=1 Tax=Hyphomicrobium album TaxID=2665159 RepID=A0A6I3KI13_9HYPH|nr:hypothetical protein [Hyphomicrobium album]MTD93969.1 hypothetical protein [Hyphomicrobium album]
MRAKPSLALTSVLLALTALSSPADAACKKFGFTVNDYGKEGPTNDAKNLLDKHISEWAAQNGVSAYQTGKKSVNCELFLDVVLFDEHTCTASATVCWGDGVKPNNKTGQQSAAAETTPTEESGDHPPAPMRKAEAMGVAPQQAAAAPAAEAATPAAAAADNTPPAAPVAPVEQAAAPAETSPAIPAVQTTAPAAPTPSPTGAAVETGALQAGAGMTAISKPAAAGLPEKDRAAAAAAAASAAAAAERAAVAAETAANAAKEAAAAAVAASAASKGTASVPPLDHASTGGKPPHNE